MDNFTRYLEAVKKLFPRGVIWSNDWMTKLKRSLVYEIIRVTDRFDDLFTERNPGTSVELLDKWETDLALPDDTSNTTDRTTAVRQQEALAKYTSLGGQSRQFYIDLAARLGVAIIIEENLEAGDETVFIWNARSAEVPIYEASCNDAVCGDPIRSWGIEHYEKAMDKRKPAHTRLIFCYGGV